MREQKWHYWFNTNGAQSWRWRIGNALRVLAAKIDGRESLGIHMETEPYVSKAIRRDCVRQGLHVMEVSLANAAREAAKDALFKACFPVLCDEGER